MQLYLRDALPGDTEQLVGLVLAGKLTIDADDQLFLDDYVDALDEIDHTDGSYLLVAELGGRIVGMLQLITFRHFQHRGGRCAEIESMHVADDERGRGIGGRLVEYAISRAKDIGCYRVQLTSNNARADAHRFYEAHGFEHTHHGYKRYLDLDWTPTRSASRRRPIDAAVAG
ncbi:MAG: GNAT family N-acetyltransferase [Ilumatobacter sp.]|nr:GNAT family N-acetyltransferase [Ilumatobacter sp.]